MKHILKGNAESKQVTLDGARIDIEYSQEFRHHSDSFDWGNLSASTCQLALAVILILTGNYHGYQRFKHEILSGLPENLDFEIEFDSEFSKARLSAIRNAMACNKDLTKRFLQGKTNKELLCWTHPIYREDLARELGLKKVAAETYGGVMYV